jgi:hypothetical protein
MTATESIRTISTQRGRATDTFVVEVDGDIAEHDDLALATAVGYTMPNYFFGFTVDRTSIDANRATVRLHKD